MYGRGGTSLESVRLAATSFPRSLAKWSPNLEFGRRIGNGAGSGKGAFGGLVLEGVDLDLDVGGGLEPALEEVVLEERCRKVGVKRLKRLVRERPQRRLLVSVAWESASESESGLVAMRSGGGSGTGDRGGKPGGGAKGGGVLWAAGGGVGSGRGRLHRQWPYFRRRRHSRQCLQH